MIGRTPNPLAVEPADVRKFAYAMNQGGPRAPLNLDLEDLEDPGPAADPDQGEGWRPGDAADRGNRGQALRVCLGRRPSCASRPLFVPPPPPSGPCRLEYTTFEKALRRCFIAAGSRGACAFTTSGTRRDCG
jgi:hypothetical protein